MAGKPKHKMPISERAKQFAPFSSLNGMYETLSVKEKFSIPHGKLADDAEEQLNRMLIALQCGMNLQTVYYGNGQYKKTNGKVTKVDAEHQKLYISDCEIDFNDLYDIVML